MPVTQKVELELATGVMLTFYGTPQIKDEDIDAAEVVAIRIHAPVDTSPPPSPPATTAAKK